MDAFKWSPDGRQFFYSIRVGAPRKLFLPNYSGRVVTARTFDRQKEEDVFRPGDLSRRGPPDEGTDEELFERPIPGGGQRRGEKEIDEQSSHADNSPMIAEKELRGFHPAA
ncbi:MAG: hypothetical protein DMG57_08545 [Acidobacteria bacterium]|nr:MAG: hypothetical protein DMG57_08545 [Acidobacteriota bacterium]